MSRKYILLSAILGWAESWNNIIWQYRLSNVNSIPMCHDGRMDDCLVSGKETVLYLVLFIRYKLCTPLFLPMLPAFVNGFTISPFYITCFQNIYGMNYPKKIHHVLKSVETCDAYWCNESVLMNSICCSFSDKWCFGTNI